jgi:hypothetical protein
MERRLDRDRPLWECWIVDGLPNNRWAILMKIHHGIADGIAATHMLARLCDNGGDGTFATEIGAAKEPARDGGHYTFDLSLGERPGHPEPLGPGLISHPAPELAAGATTPGSRRDRGTASPVRLDPFLHRRRAQPPKAHARPTRRSYPQNSPEASCKCGSTPASVHPPQATHVSLQPEAFGLKSSRYG